jgi:crotonobetainyl-CoA:carnitine CoA-transferase CaiB-like acyl-CoA transferase
MRVIEIAGGPAAGFTGLLLAELGSEVIKVEPPAADSFAAAPTAVPDADTLAFLDRRKRNVAIDLHTRAGTDVFLRLVADADAVVEDLGPGELGRLRLSYNRLRRTNTEVVVASISPFGASGPRSRWQASELVLQAAGGMLHTTGWQEGPPLKLAGYSAHFIAGLNAATAVAAAVYGVEAGTEGGVHLDISAEECYLHHWSRHTNQWAYTGAGAPREQSLSGRQGFPHTAMAADGWLFLLALRAGWEDFTHFLGLDQFMTPEWSDPSQRAGRWPEVRPHFEASVTSRSKYDWFADASARGYTFAPIEDAFEVMDGPQARARRSFDTTVIDGTDLPVAGLPFPWPEPPSPNRPPRKGEHTRAVLAELGLDEDAINALAAKGVI